MKQLLVLLAFALAARPLQAASSHQPSLVARLFASQANSSSYLGKSAGIEAEYRDGENLAFGLGYETFGRTFLAGPDITDRIGTFTLSYDLQGGRYFELSAARAPDAQIRPLTSVQLTPRLAAGKSDFSLGFGWNHYREMDAGLLRPSYMYFFSDQLRAAIAIPVLRTNQTLVAEQFSVTDAFTDLHSLRFDVAGGRTLEDAGLQADFNTLSVEYGYRFLSLTIFGSVGTYWSTSRTEQNYGLRMELR